VGRAARLLRILPGEGEVASRLLLFMLVVWFGFAIGANAVEGLMLAEVGPDALPYLYVGLAFVAAGVMLYMQAVLARPRPQRHLLVALLVMAGAVAALRLLLTLGDSWVRAMSWLAMMVMWTGAVVVTWGIAGAAHDSRQAKRLFPLYASGIILGAALGGAATAPLARLWGPENLLFVWAVALGSGFAIARSALRLASVGVERTRASRVAGTLRHRLANGVAGVRASPLLLRMAVSLGLFALLHFTLTLLFARAATARFPEATELAGFLGSFMGVTSGAALLLSLLATSRLSARLGTATLVVALPFIHLAGFTVLVASTAFTPLLGFRLSQVVWMNGVWASAWQALYNVVPEELREGARVLVDGVAFQAGVACAGVVLILADATGQPRVAVTIGLGAAALAVVASLGLRRTYAGAVIGALRAGNPDVFLVEREPFAGVGHDAAALSVVRRATTDADPAVRRVSVEILGESGTPGAGAELERALADDDAAVRHAALRALTGLELEGIAHVAGECGRLLADDDPAVRLAAMELWARGPQDGADAVEPLLSDEDPRVRARVATLLLRSRARDRAEVTLEAMIRSNDPVWRAEAVRSWVGADKGARVAAGAAADPDPGVRRAALSALAGSREEASIHALVAALGDAEPSLRAAAVDALVATGEAAVPALTSATSHPELMDGATHALARLGALDHAALHAYVRGRVSLAVRHAGLLAALAEDDGERERELVAHALWHTSRSSTLDALRVCRELWGVKAAAAIDLATENLEARDPAQRANALEMLEAVGDPAVVRPVVAVWEGRVPPSITPPEALGELMRDPNPWLRAASANAARSEPRLREALLGLADKDTDTLVREAAEAALGGGAERLETLSTLSLMERIVFLRRVSLFRDLSPADLKQVAEISAEHAFADGTIIAEQGEPGDEMHVVVSGTIVVLLRRDDGAPREVARRAVGECVGEMAVISGSPRMASLAAQGDVRTLAIDRRRFERILRERPQASLAVMGVLCERLREHHGAEPPEARS
jgi:HEAT repeat protein